MAVVHQQKLIAVTHGIDNLKFFSLLVVAWFTFLFNVERLDGQGTAYINLTNNLYILTLCVGVVILAFPNVQRINHLVIGLVFEALLLISYVFTNGHSTSMPETILIESILLGTTVWLMHNLSAQLEQVEEGVDGIVLANDSSHILPYDEAMLQAQLELEGASERPMTVVYCTLASNDADFLNFATPEEILKWNMEKMYQFRLRQVELGRQIMSLTYLGDIIFEYGNGIAVCLLEVDAKEVETFIYKLDRFVDSLAYLNLWIGTATYPNEGQSFNDLLELATQRLHLYAPPPDTDLSENTINGDVHVGVQERLQIKEAAAWVDSLAYQSETSRSIYRVIKQIMDIIAADIMLLMLSPILLVIAAAIVITDGRPVFYGHERVGLGGKPFRMLKFRSMYRNAKPLEPVIVQLPDGTTRMDWPEKLKDDPRVTRVGRPLRKWSLDELPQFINVARGDMSMIGPRPSSWGLEKHTLMQTARLSVKPGITGLWQVCARDTLNFDERLIWDLKYVQKMSLWLDIQILLRTAGAVLRRTGV